MNSKFKDFKALFQKTFIIRQKTKKTDKIIWNNVKWLRFTKEQGIILFKYDFIEDKNFMRVDWRQNQSEHFNISERVPEIYEEMLPIAKPKKDDLIDLLRFIRPEAREFYESLKCVQDTIAQDKNLDPDLDRTEENAILPMPKITKTKRVVEDTSSTEVPPVKRSRRIASKLQVSYADFFKAT